MQLTNNDINISSTTNLPGDYYWVSSPNTDNTYIINTPLNNDYYVNNRFEKIEKMLEKIKEDYEMILVLLMANKRLIGNDEDSDDDSIVE